MSVPRVRLRLVVALLGAAAFAVSPGPALAAISTAYPTQSLGDRGTDVVAIQLLINARLGPAPPTGGRVEVSGRNLVTVAVNGIFDDATAAAIRVLQSRNALRETGVVDPATWRALVVPIGATSRGSDVVAVQRLLREKRGASVPLDGTYGTATRAAVVTFQKHMGLAATGSVDGATWRALVWHFELPRFSAAGLCDYSVGNGAANWGTASAVASIEAAGAAMVDAGYGRVAVGDVGLEHGGDIAGHQTHEHGLDADLRPMRKANDQCAWGTNWRLSSYDRSATRALIKAIRSIAPSHVKLIYFNDPVLIGEGLTRPFAGHDDHLHVRFCEATHPLAAYDC
jgi:peptidoglycan hydrolase-like protein with peptidoglycan-binding domain